MVRRKNAEPIDWPCEGPALDDFVTSMLARGDELYRDLPWRHVDDPYAVLVSEIMLQQTQVTRVGRFWERFLSAFPTVDALAAAAVPDVLELWQGLGYNRRALALKRTADRCAAEGAGRLPETYEGHRSGYGGGGGGLRLSAAGRLSGDQRALGVFARALSRRGGRKRQGAFAPGRGRRLPSRRRSRSAPLVLRPARLRRASEGHGAEPLPVTAASRLSRAPAARSAPGSPAACSPLPRAFPARPCSPT